MPYYREREALHDARELSQIPLVVELDGGGQEDVGHVLVQHERRRDDALRQLQRAVGRRAH
eukprot:2256036-Prymnesium_polylepis.1